MVELKCANVYSMKSRKRGVMGLVGSLASSIVISAADEAEDKQNWKSKGDVANLEVAVWDGKKGYLVC